MMRSAMLSISLLLAANPSTVAAQALSALPTAASYRPSPDDDSSTVVGARLALGSAEHPSLSRIGSGSDTARGAEYRSVLLGARIMVAAAAAVRISVDDAEQWRQCGPNYPQPYPSYDRSLSRQFYDGVCMARWEHHVARVFIAQTTDAAARELFGTRQTPAASLTTVVVGAGPHLLSHLHRPPGDPPGTVGDAVTDLWLASMPLALSVPKRFGGRWTGFALWAGGYALVYPYARP